MSLAEMSLEEKRILLQQEYIKDGADPETAKDAARSEPHPEEVLRNIFNYGEES